MQLLKVMLAAKIASIGGLPLHLIDYNGGLTKPG